MEPTESIFTNEQIMGIGMKLFNLVGDIAVNDMFHIMYKSHPYGLYLIQFYYLDTIEKEVDDSIKASMK